MGPEVLMLRSDEDSSAGTRDVVAGVLINEGRVLMCHRHPCRTWYPNVWDLPGGHVEVDEAPQAALRRELLEELGVDVGEITATPAWCLVERTEGYRLLIWGVRSWSGSITNAAPDEHDRLGWFTKEDLSSLELADSRYRPLLTRMLMGWPAGDLDGDVGST